MHTVRLDGALIGHLVGVLGRYVLEDGFTSSWRALSWHELPRGRAAGCRWVTGEAARPSHQGRGPGRSAATTSG
jgi:hypothetical protein